MYVQMQKEIIAVILLALVFAGALINIKYGYNIVSVAEKVQSRVLEAVEAGTGIENVEVNVHVTGIAF